jgi:xanthine dehydrogenase YagS FAD-binding subunit
MKNFQYSVADSLDTAKTAILERDNCKLIGGGTSLIDLMRENIEQPDEIVDVSRLSKQIQTVGDDGLLIDAAVKNTDLANNLIVRDKFPVLSSAIVVGASGQIRNVATVAGNMLQRTRCLYFYDDAAKCNKRNPGSGCDAINGINRMHAIFGSSNSCVATHPSDMCIALRILDTKVNVEGPDGKREIDFADFHKLPGDTPHIETELKPTEIITSIQIGNAHRGSSAYRKVRDRSSYAFALVSVACILKVENETVQDVAIALGGVAHRPWRAETIESELRGKPATEENFRAAIDKELASAVGLKHNEFKIELSRRAILSVLTELKIAESAR